MASEQDIQDVIKTLIAEGVGEGEEGMRRIAETILNRAEQRGISPAEVVRERNQYTGYSSPGPGAVKAFNDPAAVTAAQAAWALAQGPDDPTGGANHYFNPNIVTPSWAKSMTPTGTYGGHAFYTDRPVMIPKVAPVPASVEDRVTARNTNPPNSLLQQALNAEAAKRATAINNQVTPASVEDRVTARNRVPTPSAFNGDPMTPAVGTVIASIPTQGPSTRTVPTTRVGNSANNIKQAREEQASQRPLSGLTAQGAAPSASDKARGNAPVVQAPKPSMPTTQQIWDATGFRGGPPAPAPDRLRSDVPYGNQTLPVMVADASSVSTRDPIGTGAVTPVSPGVPIESASVPLPRIRPQPAPTASVPASAPVMRAPVQQPPVARAPVMRAPLRIVVEGPRNQAPMLSPQQQAMIAAQNAVNQSGDTSVGSQLDAAAARASGEGGRIRRY